MWVLVNVSGMAKEEGRVLESKKRVHDCDGVSGWIRVVY